MKRAVAALGEDDVKQLLEEQGKIEVTCQFCNDQYHFGEQEMQEWLAESAAANAANAELDDDVSRRFDQEIERLKVPILLLWRTLGTPVATLVV